MNVSHYLEQIEGKPDMNRWTVYEFIQRIIIEFLDEMTEEDFVLMH